MRYLKTLLLALLLPACAFAAGWDDNEYKRIEQSIQLPKIAERQFLITAFGAKTTATAAQNQKAINRVISLVSKKGGGKVIIPKGTWNTGAIELKSHVNLVLEEGATLHFAFEPKLYPWYVPLGKVWLAGTTLPASMPTRLPTLPLPVREPSMEVATTTPSGSGMAALVSVTRRV